MRNRIAVRLSGFIAIMAALFTGLVPNPALAVESTGEPAFAVDYWSMTLPGGADTLEAGMVFDLIVTFRNIGTYGANNVLLSVGTSSTFVALGANTSFDHMGINAQATVTIQVGVSETVASGYFNIPIEISYHHEMLGGGRATDSINLGVYVAGEEDDSAGEPELLIDNSALAPDENGTLVLTLTLLNNGYYTASGVSVTMGQSAIFAPVDGGSSTIQVDGAIAPGAQTTAKLPVLLIDSSGGVVSQEFILKYLNADGSEYSSSQTASILMDGASGSQPQLLIQGVTTEPETITPGATIRMTLDIANIGGGEAADVLVQLGSSVTDLDPFAPVGTSNVIYVDSIPGRSHLTVGYDLALNGDAASGLVPMNVNLTYDNTYGVATSKDFGISLRVNNALNLIIQFYEAIAEPVVVGDTIDLPVEIINIGTNSINVNNVMVTSDLFTISNGTLYMGQLDGGTSGSLIAEGTAQQAGTANVAIEINYLDDFQQPQVYTERLMIDIAERTVVPAADIDTMASADAPGAAGNTAALQIVATEMTVWQRIWQGIIGFFGFGG